MSKALIVWGGWEGHEPCQVAQILADALDGEGFEVDVRHTLDAFAELPLEEYDLLVPEWTMGSIEREQLQPMLEAVRGGVGIAGVHGGMGDSFRQETEYQYMVGGQWVAHPGGDGVAYTVRIVDRDHAITKGLTDFDVSSEKYYMHVDPAVHVLAVTDFGDVAMPIAWTKQYGKGRVFYCSLGHVAQVFDQDPQILELVKRGMVWAARKPE
ncbi:MAG: ThuA domain-containing protein [Anaerolineae bacterium]